MQPRFFIFFSITTLYKKLKTCQYLFGINFQNKLHVHTAHDTLRSYNTHSIAREYTSRCRYGTHVGGYLPKPRRLPNTPHDSPRRTYYSCRFRSHNSFSFSLSYSLIIYSIVKKSIPSLEKKEKYFYPTNGWLYTPRCGTAGYFG